MRYKNIEFLIEPIAIFEGVTTTMN